jgi:hypothetical protein
MKNLIIMHDMENIKNLLGAPPPRRKQTGKDGCSTGHRPRGGALSSTVLSIGLYFRLVFVVRC